MPGHPNPSETSLAFIQLRVDDRADTIQNQFVYRFVAEHDEVNVMVRYIYIYIVITGNGTTPRQRHQNSMQPHSSSARARLVKNDMICFAQTSSTCAHVGLVPNDAVGAVRCLGCHGHKRKG